MSVQIAKRSFTVDEYNLMGEAGILSERDRVELLEGEVVEMSPIGSRHAACVDRLNRLLNRMNDLEAIIRVQNPIRLDNLSEPQPDVALLRARDDFYANSHPAAVDVMLVVEVADSSVEIDRAVKLPLYAQSGIAEVWIVNLLDDVIDVYARPVGGAYQRNERIGHGKVVSALTIPNLALGADDILG